MFGNAVKWFSMILAYDAHKLRAMIDPTAVLHEFVRLSRDQHSDQFLLAKNSPYFEYMVRFSLWDLAACSGDLEFFELSLKFFGNSKFLQSGGSDIYREGIVAKKAAKFSRIPVLDFLLREGMLPSNLNLFYTAARFNQFGVLKWLHKNIVSGCTPSVMDVAAMNGNLEILVWLHQNRTEGCTQECMNVAAENGQLSALKWLHENRKEPKGFFIIYSNPNMSEEIKQWLESKNYQLSPLPQYLW